MYAVYVSHYTQDTPIQSNKLPDVADIAARAQLLREHGAMIIDEINHHCSLCPVYAFEIDRPFTDDELSVLCLAPLGVYANESAYRNRARRVNLQVGSET